MSKYLILLILLSSCRPHLSDRDAVSLLCKDHQGTQERIRIHIERKQIMVYYGGSLGWVPLMVEKKSIVCKDGETVTWE